ncbi:MAG: hypothetical protein F9K49_08320 [Caedimonadaceae bacterium]|nr:MAG: hypothetical protein F9K49_08320 [Caedimonadaceae bacterium]
MEYGVVVPQGIGMIRKQLPEIVADRDNELTSLMREMFAQLYTYFIEKDEQIRIMDSRIIELCKQSEVCRRLVKVEGINYVIRKKIKGQSRT